MDLLAPGFRQPPAENTHILRGMSAPQFISPSSDVDDQVAEVALTRLVRMLARQTAREEFRERSEGDAAQHEGEISPAESKPQFYSQASGQ